MRVGHSGFLLFHACHRARAGRGKVVGEDIDNALYHVDGGECDIRDRVIVHLSVICHSHVAHNHSPVHFNVIAGSDDNMVPVVIGLPHALRLAVAKLLDFFSSPAFFFT